jgi:hypothetical protein
MADRATGPVKPPVIDLTARAANARPEADKPAANDAGRRPEPAMPLRAEPAPNWPLLGAVALGGAVLGTVLTYLVAFVLPLPTHVQLPPDLTPIVDGQSQQIAELKTTLTDVDNRTIKTQVSLDATIATIDANMADVGKQIADLKATIPTSAPAVDLAPLEMQLNTLKSQVDALAAGAPGTDAGAIAQSLADLKTGVTAVTTRLNGIDTSIGSIRTDLDTARKTLSDHISAALPSEIGPALKLPLILSSLATAFETGKPFQAELASLQTIVPDVAIADPLRAASTTGLSRPDTLLAKFEATLPQILAARSINSSDWAQNAIDWAKSLLALRPAEEQQGDSPEAIASRLEAAMNRHDYAAAGTLIVALPAPMQAAAAPVAADIAAHAAADQLLADLRAKALTAADTAK